LQWVLTVKTKQKYADGDKTRTLNQTKQDVDLHQSRGQRVKSQGHPRSRGHPWM